MAVTQPWSRADIILSPTSGADLQGYNNLIREKKRKREKKIKQTYHICTCAYSNVLLLIATVQYPFS